MNLKTRTPRRAMIDQEIKNRLERMMDGEAICILGVNVRKDGCDWWIQAGAGVQYTAGLWRVF